MMKKETSKVNAQAQFEHCFFLTGISRAPWNTSACEVLLRSPLQVVNQWINHLDGWICPCRFFCTLFSFFKGWTSWNWDVHQSVGYLVPKSSLWNIRNFCELTKRAETAPQWSRNMLLWLLLLLLLLVSSCCRLHFSDGLIKTVWQKHTKKQRLGFEFQRQNVSF